MDNISEIPYKERLSKSLRKFANIRCIEAKEVKRTKQKGLDFYVSGSRGLKRRGRGGCIPVVHGAYYNLYVQELLSFGGGSSCSISATATLFGSFPLSGTKLMSLLV